MAVNIILLWAWAQQSKFVLVFQFICFITFSLSIIQKFSLSKIINHFVINWFINSLPDENMCMCQFFSFLNLQSSAVIWQICCTKAFSFSFNRCHFFFRGWWWPIFYTVNEIEMIKVGLICVSHSLCSPLLCSEYWQ